jgi:AcrR family transcriptional regulator
LNKPSFAPALSAPSPTRLPSGQRREEILKAAAALYIENGPGRTSTRQIAQVVGISQPSLYAHFPTKDALSYALCEQAFAILQQRMDAQLIRLDEPKHAFQQLIRGYVGFALEEPVAYQIAFMMDLSFEPETLADLQDHVGLRTFGKFRNHIEDLQARGAVRAAPTDLMAQSIWAAMHGLCALLLARPKFPWADLEALIGVHIDLIVTGAQCVQD